MLQHQLSNMLSFKSKSLVAAIIFAALSVLLRESFAQKGKFEKPGININLAHPVTTFDRQYTYVDVRNEILSNPLEFGYYDTIRTKSYYRSGTQAYIAVHSAIDLTTLQETPQYCAFHARSQAFVALIGIDANHNYGNMDTIRKYYGFAIKSLYALKDDKKIFRKQHDKSSQLFRAPELIYALQAYDMLRAVKELYPTEFTDDDLDILGGKLSKRRKDRHLQYFSRNLYRKSSQMFGIFINRDNHTLIVSAALGMSSIVLHDRGSKRRKQYSWQPITWANEANWYINDRMWTSDVKTLSNDGGRAGYTEGPGYYQYAFNYLFPYFLTFNNAFEKDIEVDFCKHSNNCETVRNYFYDPRYDALTKWFNAITLDNDVSPTYDDTGVDVTLPKSAIMRKSSLYQADSSNHKNNNKYDLDVLASGTNPSEPSHKPSTILPKSGNAIYRTPYKTESKTINRGRHYFHLLFEPSNARDDLNWWSSNLQALFKDYNPSTHEHDDMGSFMIYADEVPLIFDPPYQDFAYHQEVLGGNQHNSLLIKHGHKYEGSSYKTNNAITHFDYSNPRYRTMSLAYHLDRLDALNIKHILGNAERTIEVFNDDDPNTEYYYVVTDFVNAWGNDAKDIRMTINGNGVYTDLSTPNDHRFKWEVGGVDWGVLVENTSLLSNANYSTEIGYSWLNNYSTHTRQLIDVNAKNARFLTIYRPFKPSLGIESPSHTTNTGEYSSMYIDSIGNDLQIHSHFIKQKQDTVINIPNPFGLNPSSYISTDAQGGFLFLSHHNFISNRCVSNTNFRKADIKSGNFLSYHDSNLTKYISTEYVNIEWDSACFNKKATTYYELMSKFKYRGVTFIENESCANVSYYLPDTEPGYQLNVIDELSGEVIPSHYNSATKTITVNFSKYITQFIVQLADPCMLACYFPPTSETIDSTFNFDNGTTEVLTDDLDIVQPSGFLNISGGSVMSLCEDVALVNSDSLELTGNEPKYFENYDAEGNLIGTDTIVFISKIVINRNAALILDSTSVTNLNVNSQILVKSGGTLLIKAGAKLMIGGKNTNGLANILVEDSAYLCIEEGARISFYNLGNEFIEDNHLKVTFSPTPHAAYEALNQNAASGAFSTGGRFESSICLSLCNIGFASNPYGISNEQYGWSNFIKSNATIFGDSIFCKNEEIKFNAARTLNETKYYLLAYLFSDSLSKFVLIDSTYVIGRISNLSGRNEIGKHKIVLVVDNDCDHLDTVEHIYHVIDTPISTFTLNTHTICSGYSKVEADGHLSSFGKHVWSVERIGLYDEAGSSMEEELDEYDDNLSEEGWSEEWHFNGAVSELFTFPGFKFEGGYRYVVNLTLYNACGMNVIAIDTIVVGTGVDIFYYDETASAKVQADTVIFHYAEPGISIIKLKGIAKQSTKVVWYDEFWNPLHEVDPTNHYLDESTLEVTSNSSMKYYCVATSPSCSDTDSIYIIVNNHSIIVNNKSRRICTGQAVELSAYNFEQYNGATYLWKNDYIVGDTTNHIVYVHPPQSTIVKLTMEYQNTIEIDYYEIIVQDSIDAEINVFAVDSSFCFVLEVANMTDVSKVYWNFNDGSNIDSSLAPCHIFPNDTVSMYNICVTIINECSVVDTCFWIDINTTPENLLSNGAIHQLKISNDEAVGNEQNKFSKLALQQQPFAAYPNPFGSYLLFKIPSSDNQIIYVYDVIGKVVDEIVVNQNKQLAYYDTSRLTPGVYVARFGTEAIKLIKR